LDFHDFSFADGLASRLISPIATQSNGGSESDRPNFIFCDEPRNGRRDSRAS
jgi:hypothetical protein